MPQVIAIYHYDYQGRWYWVWHISPAKRKISPCDNISKERCLERVRTLQADGSLPKCPVTIKEKPEEGQEPPLYQDRPICDEDRRR